MRTLDSSTRFGFKFFRIILKNGHPGKLHSTFFPLKKLALLFLLKEVKPPLGS